MRSLEDLTRMASENGIEVFPAWGSREIMDAPEIGGTIEDMRHETIEEMVKKAQRPSHVQGDLV